MLIVVIKQQKNYITIIKLYLKLINPEWKDLALDWYESLNVIQALIHRKGITRRSSSGL